MKVFTIEHAPSNHDETPVPNGYASATWRPVQNLLGKDLGKGHDVVVKQARFAMSFKGVDDNDSIVWRLRQAYHDETGAQ